MEQMAFHLAQMRFLMFVITCAACTAQTSPPNLDAGDEAAIKDVVARYVDARDRKDAKATEALFTADADQLVSSGEWRRGRDAVVRGTMASSESSGGKRTITVETVRFVAPGDRAGRRPVRDRGCRWRSSTAHVEHVPDHADARWLAHRRNP